MQRVELSKAKLFFAWTSPRPEAAEANYEAAEESVQYPDEFFVAELLTDLEAWAQGIAMDLGETMNKKIKKMAARRIAPEMTPEEFRLLRDFVHEQFGLYFDAAHKSSLRTRLSGRLSLLGLETFDTVASEYTRLRRLQAQDIALRLKSANLTPSQERKST